MAGLLLCSQALAQEALRGPEAFASIADDKARSVALFEEMGKVLTHPRCLNCHPVDDMPRQGDEMRVHQPQVSRGESDFGVAGMRCNTCHSPENVVYVSGEGSIPGHDPWHLAPPEMGWIGLPLSAICEQLKDRERNGGRTLKQLVEHNAEDGLVGWGWEPGQGREPAPGSQEIFGALTEAWVDAGAGCPAE
ncbi:Isoquinoline 1-oxidoreductase subunit [Notoacmeibacter ruber]|uniref:Isoquinoline 1-oxidoreductase subunit n=1 Tax=Notoacmeibacter ruber TaxID=2670375 RepID=A0A3L7JG65_9HYPH|nr:Isoquinoline 1-oxidoreductase subunit [Notoacmeibacter ruber]